MAAPTTTEQLLDLIRKSNTVASPRLEEYLAALSGSGSQGHDPKQLAARLVRDGLITSFQAEQFLQGRWKGFSLGKYRILEKLGAGGMGAVFLCEHNVMNHRVAIKVLPAEKAEDKAALGRFYREARAAAGLDHPNIVRAFDIDQDGDRHFLVMEYVDGSSLQDLVRRRGPLELIRAAHYIRQAAFGLQRAHEAGLVHRDVKPGNLLVDRAGIVKVADLGLARFFHDENDNLTRQHDDGAILGSADYFAPEQAVDSHAVDIRGDIYALGCTFYFLLTGRPPFHEATVTQKLLWHQMKSPRPVQELRPDVPRPMAEVLERMLAKKPDERFQTPAAVAHALEPWTATPIASPPEADFRRLSPAAEGPRSGDTRPGPGSSRTKITYPPIPEQPREPSTEAAPTDAAFAWDKLDNSAIRYESAPPETTAASGHTGASARLESGSSSRLNLGALPRKSLLLAAGGLFALIAVGLGLWWGLTRRPRPTETGTSSAFVDAKVGKGVVPTPPAHGAIRLFKTKTGREEGFDKLWTALGKAEPGDRIVVQSDTLEELLILKGDGKLMRDITIEGKTASGRPVLWRAEAGHGQEQPLLALDNTPGLRLTGFVLDGLGRVNDLIAISERCPGLLLDGVQFRGFLRSAVTFANCEGEPFRPVTLRGVATTVEKEAETALLFEGKLNQHVDVSDSRFVGQYKAAVRIAGPLAHTTFQRNRFAQGGDAFRFLKATPAARLHLVVASNTFAEFETGLHWETVPPGGPGNHVLVRDNLFLKTKTLAVTEGVRTQPDKTTAQWIWSDESLVNKEAAPAESRYFRKAFDVPKGAVTQPTVEIACDDSFTVWLNGVQVGRSPFDHYTKRVYSLELPSLLRAGRNVLAVQGTNRADFMTGQPTGARLLVQLAFTVAGKPTAQVVSDQTWKAAKTAPQGWQQPNFNDSAWAAASVLGPYETGGSGSHSQLTWDATARQLNTQAWQRVFTALGNVRDGSGREGYPSLEAQFGNVSLPTDPTKDAEFLRYPAASPLASAGVERKPVGAPPPEPTLTPARIVLVQKDGREHVCRTVRDALLQARSGARVVVRGELLEEALMLWGKDGFVGPVVLEGVSSNGKPVHWRVPANQPRAQPLVRLTDLTGLTVKGFLFDGRDRVDDLLALVGYCPNVLFEDVQLRGFRRTGMVLRDCTGLQDQPVTLRRLRTTTLAGSDSALSLEADPGQSLRFLHIHDCRFEGPYEAAVRINAPVAELDLRRNRVVRAGTGIVHQKAEPRHPLHMTVDSCTFLDVSRILHLEAMPGPDPANQIVLRNNLFARATRLVHANGFEFEPKSPAHWIWFPDTGDLLKGAPVGPRFFRKSFDLPKDKITSATLNMVCDDAFTVWLNGKEVGKGQLHPQRRFVSAFDVVKHVHAGVNVLAIEGRNTRGVAGLLVQLSVQTNDEKAAKDHSILSDGSWRTAKESSPDWQQPAFADADWQPARVVTSYAKPHPSWRYFIWQSQLDRQKEHVLWPLLHPSSVGNVSSRNAGVSGGYTLIDVTGDGTPTALGTDPDHDARFLRYSRDNPLAQAGAGKGPVGVPPVE